MSVGAAFALSASCSERPLRPLNPCTTSAVSDTVPIDNIRNVDVLFVVDNSGSMRPIQAKLRNEFPRMIRALLTGDTDLATPGQEYPAVGSLRVAVVTSDMGVAGVGSTLAHPTKISSCGANSSLPGGVDLARSLYGDDGGFRLRGSTVRVNGQTVVDCDVVDAAGNPGADGIDDAVSSSQLPGYLTFDAPANGMPATADVDEYVRRVSCFANTGTLGCTYEQQLESMLKALTPGTPEASDALVGGRFFHESVLPARGLGQGTDTNTTADDLVDTVANGGWLRSDSLLAVVLVTDEEDCSSNDPRVFDFNSTDPTYGDPYGRFQAQTRCSRFPDLSHSFQRYVQGLAALRPNDQRRLVFAALTGVPSDLTDGVGVGPDVLEGTDNLQAILDDPRMAYDYFTDLRPAGPGASLIDVPNASLRPACTHTEPGRELTGTGDVATGVAAVGAFVPAAQTPQTPVTALGNTTAGSDMVTNVILPNGARELVNGISVSGPGITPGTLAYSIIVADPGSVGPYTLFLTAPATATGTGVSLDLGATYGPGKDQVLSGPGIREATYVDGVSGTGPYQLSLETRVEGPSAVGIAMTLRKLDVSAAPARRMALVARDLRAQGFNATLQSICVDSFAPAMERILRLIQANLAGSCLPRRLIRNALDQVTCDVFVTLPPNTSCASTPGMDPTPNALVPTSVGGDADGVLERCRMNQVPVRGQDVASGLPPTGAPGWFYDDYTAETDDCPSPQRISFSVVNDVSARPPIGSTMQFGCLQPVEDGDLAIDINSACTAQGTCPFGSEQAYDGFSLRYNLNARGWGADIPTDPQDPHQLVCDPNSLTCQIGCTTDADCPGGFVCFDPQSLDPSKVSTHFCVNPTCGTD